MIGIKQFLYLASCLFLLSCGNRHNTAHEEAEVPMKHASFLRMYEGDGYTRVAVTNPWDTTKTLHSYILVPDSLPLDDNYPAGTIIRTPIKRSVVFSSVHGSLLEELGAINAVAGVCDTEYMHNNTLAKKLKEGKITDCGSSMAADMEKIISINPDALFISPYQDPAPYAKLTELGVPIVECADYMETNPLGRAEWIKFYSALTGTESEGDKIFSEVENEYQRLKQVAATVKNRPEILTELKQGDTWFLPAKSSTTGIFIEDAGGRLPDIVNGEGGSVAFTPEKVLMNAADADFWLIKYYNDNDISYQQISNEAPINRNFDAFKKGKIYACNTSKIWFYEEVPFHPHWLLADMISIFHPELGIAPYPGKKYYSNPTN